MSFSLAGKAGLVTGAASGIGRGTALELAVAGASVVVADLERSRPGAEQTVRAILDAGGSATFVPTDVRNPEEQLALVAATVDTYGSLDFAVNNAGVLPPKVGSLAELTVEDYDLVHDVNLRGVFLGLRAQLPRMAEQGVGSIVNIASVAGAKAIPGYGSYVASKHGVIGLTRSAALEYGAFGIRVNAILPNSIRSGMMADTSPEIVARVTAPQAIKRIGEPEEVGAAVSFLCSDRAAFITGITLPIDGGFLLGS